MQPLEDMVPSRLRGVGGLKFVWDINNAGQIAGDAWPVGDPISSIAFLLSPVNPTMDLLPPAPGVAGEVNTLQVTGATPGATVHFVYGRHGGGFQIAGCDLQENALQIDSPTIIGSAVADASGHATIDRFVPPIARDRTILIQAVVADECAISELMVTTIE